MKRKCLAIGIVLLFVGTCTIPTIAQNTEKSLPTSRGDWLYVGGSGPGNYTKIQDAIDDSNDGDTVFVYDDSSPYYEHLIINESIILIGENKNTSIIDGEEKGTVVLIQNYNDGVTISGFTIQRSGEYDPYRISNASIQISSSSNIIHNNIFINNNIGILVWYSLEDIYYNIIYGNTIKNNEVGIFMKGSIYYRIFDNDISNNRYGTFSVTHDIPLKRSHHSPNSQIYRNNITNNYHGISQFDWGGDDIYENNITNNRYGIHVDNMYGCGGYNNIFKNNIVDNAFGIRLFATVGGSNNNTIYQNIISNNRKGIYIGLGIGGNKIYQNIFIGNVLYNARDWSENQWDNGTIGNYWGNYIGLLFPGLFDRNDDGIGDYSYRIRPFFRGNEDRFPLMKETI